MLPAVRVMSTYYDASKLKTPIDREHAMIDGVVVDNKGKAYDNPSPDLLPQTDVQLKDAQQLDDQKIKVTKAGGGAQITVPQALQAQYEDFYVMVHVKRGQPDSNHVIDVNGYQNERLFNASKYRTGQYDLLYRTKPNDQGTINIDLSPAGPYEFELLGLYGENYETLRYADKTKHYTYKENRASIDIRLKNHDKGMMVLNAPYRKGMQAKVDGKPVEPQKVNYFMTGVPVDQNAENVVITYRPPYFFTMLIISIFSTIAGIVFSKWLKRKTKL